MALDLSQFGGYNDFPIGWRKIDAAEFAQSMTLWSLQHQEYRQMIDKNDRSVPALSGRLFFFWNQTGVAVVSKSVRKASGYGYETVGEFYAFGCNHEYEPVEWDQETMGPQFRFNHASKCKKCDHIWIVDSSD